MLLNLNSIAVYFKDFDCEFQNIYFPEQVSVLVSEKHIFISEIKFSWVFLLYLELFLSLSILNAFTLCFKQSQCLTFLLLLK